jgi:GTP1/Obg family GTP-binding protein
MQSISLRIKELINYKNHSISSFEKEIGAGNNSIGTLIRKDSNISGDILSKILSKFPEVNANWLITGKGNMLIEGLGSSSVSENVDENKSSDSNVELLKEQIALLRENAILKDDAMELQRTTIAKLKSLLSETQEELEHCKQMKNIPKNVE